MGLLDAMFDQGSYGGQGGGLLDMLRNSQMQQSQLQPSAGFQPPASFNDRFTAAPGAPQAFQPSGPGVYSEAFDPQGFAPNQAQPIAVGANYQMPRIGAADQFSPQQAMLPPNAQPTQGQLPTGQPMAQAAPQALPPALAGYGGGLSGAFQGLARNAHTGPIGALIGGIGGAMGMQSPQQQNIKAQYDALVPLLGPNKAMLALTNPEAGKILLERALEKHQYGFTKLDDGTIVRQDPRDGSVVPAYQTTPKAEFGVINEQDGQKTYGWIDKNKRTASAVPGVEPRANTVTGPDGKQIAIPEGVDRKEFLKKVSDANAKAATGEKTEVQAKSEKFGNKMENAEKNLRDIEGEGQSYKGRALEGAPLVGGTMATNWAQSPNYQKYKQARDNFITALLRDESGAAIGTQEFQRYEKELFPQPGDSPGTITQKREARKIAIEAMKKSAGPGYKSPDFGDAASAAAPADPLGIR